MALDGIKPNQTPKNYSPIFSRPKPQRSRKWKWLLALLLLILGIGVAGYFLIFARTNKIFTNQGNIFSRVGQLIIGSDKKLEGEEQGTVNVLLMGIGGEGHDGAHLTDTMIVASLNVATHEVTMISIPRDFEYVVPNVGYNKVNAVYAYAFRDDENTAGLAAITAAEKITGMEIPYYAVVDFKGFVKAVDDVGGVDVVVDNTFTDSTFPNDFPYDTKGYLSPVTFTKGPAHMDGRTALIYARSRHSGNAQEGSDFARSERQKKILTAVKDKIFSLKLSSLSTINNLLSDFTDSFRTNLEPFEMKRMLDLSKDIQADDNVFSFSLEPDGVLVCSALVDQNTGRPAPAPTPTPETPDTTGTETPETETPVVPQITRIYVVQPCAGHNLADIANFVKQSPILAKLKKEAATVEVQNSVGKTGLAAKMFGNLADLGVVLKFPAFKGKVPYEQTILYDNSHGSKPHTLDYLKAHYTFTTSDVNYPASAADFVIIVGQDSL